MAKGIDTSERLTKAFPEIPVDTLMKEHNVKEKWDALVRDVDQFVEQHATPITPRAKS